MTAVTEIVDERTRIAMWRLKVLVDAGYPLPLAERLADNARVDLHQAVELVKGGCQPDLAAEILL